MDYPLGGCALRLWEAVPSASGSFVSTEKVVTAIVPLCVAFALVSLLGR